MGTLLDAGQSRLLRPPFTIRIRTFGGRRYQRAQPRGPGHIWGGGVDMGLMCVCSRMFQNEKMFAGTTLTPSLTRGLTGTPSGSFSEAELLFVYCAAVQSRLAGVGLMLASFLQKSQLGALLPSGAKSQCSHVPFNTLTRRSPLPGTERL